MANLLLVDDDPVLLELLVRLLEKSGHTITRANNGTECLALTATQAFDLIITDVMMPDFDGYELTRRLRARPETKDTLILIFTANLQGPDADKALLAGADGYAMKSVVVTRLNQQIETLLAKGRPAPAKSA